MPHFAKIGLDNTVLDIAVVDAIDCMTRQGEFDEAMGIAHLAKLTGHQTWLLTAKDGSIRRRFALIGGTYSSGHDAFLPPQPSEGEWVLDDESLDWVPFG